MEGETQEQQSRREDQAVYKTKSFFFLVTRELTPATAGPSPLTSLHGTHGEEQQNDSPHPTTPSPEAEHFTDFILNG